MLYNKTIQNEDIFSERKGNNNYYLTLENSNNDHENILLKNKSEMNSNISEKNLEKNSLKKQNSELGDPNNKDTGLEEDEFELNIKKNRNKKHYYSKGKNRKPKNKINLYYDPNNPYLTNWANSFLKIGYNVGLHSKENQDGVPILRIQKLKPKVILPPIYKVKYNQFSETKNKVNYNEEEPSKLCAKVAQKLFSPNNTNYNNFPKNKSSNSFSNKSNNKENNENNENKDNNNKINNDNKIGENKNKLEISGQINDNDLKMENNNINKEENTIENKINNEIKEQGNNVNIAIDT